MFKVKIRLPSISSLVVVMLFFSVLLVARELPSTKGPRKAPARQSDDRHHPFPVPPHQRLDFQQRSLAKSPASSLDSAELVWESHYASGQASGYDVATAIAIDLAGNLYVAGYSSGKPYHLDYLLAKYNPAGELLWTTRYDGSGGDDYPFSIAIDQSAGEASIYITGYSMGEATGYDYATVKYDTDGIRQWAARYHSSGAADDFAAMIAIDRSGDVYVTGFSKDSLRSYDYLTLKYTPDGMLQWTARYNGPGNGADIAAALAVDPPGNVFVSGWSIGNGTAFDYATVKYHPSGRQEWVRRFNGSGNDDDFVGGLAVDDSGDVYITGRSKQADTGYDFTTIKYSARGSLKWIAGYDGPSHGDDEAVALAIDSSGSLLVTGLSESASSSFDYATVKYNAAGTEQWRARYDGTVSGYDKPTAVTVDDAGNVLVTGLSEGNGTRYDYATVKYNAEGVRKWVAYYNQPPDNWDLGTALAADQSGNVYVTGFSGFFPRYDIVTIKYDAPGNRRWVAFYDGPGNSEDTAVDLAIDTGGNVYLGGNSTTSTGGIDYAIVKYSPGGDQEWVRRYNGPANGDDYLTAIAVDDPGNVFITGYSAGAADDYATIMYNSAGEEQWTARYTGEGNFADRPTALSVDRPGNVYITGLSDNSSSSFDFLTIKYNPRGTIQWIRRYNGSTNGGDSAQALAVDDSGNVYVTGFSYNPSSSFDYVTIKYDSSGHERWIARYNGPANNADFAHHLQLDHAGYVYISGEGVGPGTFLDYVTIKYDPDGRELWVSRYDGGAGDEEGTAGLAVDPDGYVYVTGYSYSPATTYDYATVKYSPAGEEQWAVRYDGPVSNFEEAKDLVVDHAGNVYVTGYSLGEDTFYDFATLKYDPDGRRIWEARYNGPGGDGLDMPQAMAIDPAGNLYLGGFSTGDTWRIFTAIRYHQSPVTSIPSRTTAAAPGFWLGQNYPNPFNPSTTIRYRLPEHCHVTVAVFNLLGEEIITLVNEDQPAGEHRVTWYPGSRFASGLYFYLLSADDLESSPDHEMTLGGKMLLLK